MSYSYRGSRSSSVASRYSRTNTGQRRNNQNRRGPKKDYIHPDRFVRVAEPTTEESYQAVNKFDDFIIHPVIKQNVINKGFLTPSPIQDQAIPLGLNGSDIIGIANTGTGKTAAFALPILHRLMEDPKARALIVAPTRELAQQIDAEMRTLSKGSRIYSAVLTGGASIGPQLRDLRARPQLVIGTPGRIKDHIQRNTLALSFFNIVVLDEVDRMLDMGFVDDVRTILSKINPTRQSYFFSATIDAKVTSLIHTFTNNPITISVKTGDTSNNVHQDVVRIGAKHEKLDKLHDILIDANVQKSIIFDDTQRSVEQLARELGDRGFKVASIHGGKNQGQRQRALRSFKLSEVNILVATDVAARGIDVNDITHVINYSTPKDYQDYTHRIGRAGRAGKIGYALTFVTQ